METGFRQNLDKTYDVSQITLTSVC